MKITPFSYVAIIIMTRSLASTLFKEDDYSADVDILADQSSGHYSLFTTDPNPIYYGESDGKDKCLYWSSTNATWYISKYKQRRNHLNPCGTDRIFAKCEQPVLSQCNEDESSTITISSIQYCITIQEYTNLYHINGEDIYNHHTFISSDNDRVVWYDINDRLWKVTDQINAAQSYANCSKSNIFDCSSNSDPSASSFDIDTCDKTSITERPTFLPTMHDLPLKIDIAVTEESEQTPEESMGTEEYVAIEETKVVTAGFGFQTKSDITTFKTHHAMLFILIIVVVSVLCGISSAILIIGCCMWCKRKQKPKTYQKIMPKHNGRIQENMDEEIELQSQPSESPLHREDSQYVNYTQWNMQEIASWLFGLENGRYQKYINQLITGFKNDGITASDLPELDVADLRSFGMMTFHDRRDLNQHFQSLKEGPLSPGSPGLNGRICDQYARVESVEDDLDDDDESEEEEESKEVEFSEGVRKYSFKHFRMSLDMDRILEDDEEILGDDQITEGISAYAQ